MEDFETILKILDEEIAFYSDKINDDWSIDKNDGFKLGIQYCKDLIDKMYSTVKEEYKNNFDDIRNFPISMSYYDGEIEKIIGIPIKVSIKRIKG